MPPEMIAAIQVATRRKDERSFLIGCAIRRKDGALVTFSNSPCSTQRVPSHHAEARCARKADFRSVAYIARVQKDGKLAMSMPCLSCQNRLRKAGVFTAYYTNEKGEIEKLVLQ